VPFYDDEQLQLLEAAYHCQEATNKATHTGALAGIPVCSFIPIYE